MNAPPIDIEHAPLAILLPHREVYQSDGAGAVVSCVRDMAAHSRYRERLVVLGDAVAAPFAEPPLAPVAKAPWYYGRRTARYLEGAARTAAALGPALVEVHNRPSSITRLRRALPASALLLYLHNDPQGMRGFKSLAERRRILAQLDGVVCVSGHIRARLLDGLGSAEIERKTHVVLNGVDTAAVAPVADGARRKEIVFVGRWIPEKGGLLFAEAAALARAELPDWRFVMVGAWGFTNQAAQRGYEQRIVAAMHQLGTQGELTGYVPRAQALARLQQAAITVLPAQWDDPCPLSVIEGLASGCAVVASPRGGIPELVGDAGVLVHDDAPAAWAEQLRRLANDDALRTRYQQAARARAVRQLDIRVGSARLDAARAAAWQTHEARR